MARGVWRRKFVVMFGGLHIGWQLWRLLETDWKEVAGHHKTLIYTDVVVLAVSMAQGLGHKIAIGLGPKKAQSIPMLYALTGCDTVSSFVGHGKKTAWISWKALPELTNCRNYLVHQVTHWKIFCIALRGLPSHYMTGPAHAQILTRPDKTLRKEDQCEEHPTNQSNSETACKENNLPGRSCKGPDSANYLLHCLPQPTGAGPKLRMVCMNQTWQYYQKPPKS